ncbi:hypothetical protein OPKNFCMD_1792 [Methylobacterium crusticola]|uniref:Transposase DDE domain-containing protein n=1 Tax=Methylobacterium crusticola TaxID=1697972 RepID=A0ABQ4QUQ4_9HYPH|nr:hypothetical protein OPKNFCMD_1792 [Methylobacterium crusticola]
MSDREQILTNLSDFAAFVTLQLSKSAWLLAAHAISSEKTLAHRLCGGDVEGLLPPAAPPAYRGERVGTATAIVVEIVVPNEGQAGFAVQPRCWVIERTFSWISRCRRLARDHETTVSSALAFFVLAAAMILVRRLARAF